MSEFMFDKDLLDENDQATLFALTMLNRLSAREQLLNAEITQVKKNQKDFLRVSRQRLKMRLPKKL